MMDIKKFATLEQRLVSGHKTCMGCGFPTIIRHVLAATEKPVIAGLGTGCVSVTTCTYPYTSWKIPTIHNAFANLAATISGAETAYKVLKRKGRIKDEIKFVCFGGDGGTYDIGLQALSGAIERGHDFVYVCYDNQGYMNTGYQRSSATPYGAATSTTPDGIYHHGEEVFRKDLTEIIAAHDNVYAAQCSISHLADLYRKAEKAFEFKGPVFLNILSPCTLFWQIDTSLAYELSKKAVESCFWPLFEVEKGKYVLNYKPLNKIPVTEFMKPQGRFKHLFSGEEIHNKILEEIQKRVDEKWAELFEKTGQKV